MRQNESFENFIKTEQTKLELFKRYKENPQCFSINLDEKLFMLENFNQMLQRGKLYEIIVSLYKLENVNDCIKAIQCLEWFKKILLALDSNPKIKVLFL